jgi:cellulose synthase/poly-beta-1,6-N-acetylglucosamine synthase-like glycosyltransferase
MGAEVFSDHGNGLGYARNMALRLSETELLGYVDADAFIAENWLDILKHLDDPKVAAVSATTIYGYGNAPLQRLHEWLAKTKIEDVGFVSTVVRRREVIGVGGIREDLSTYEDWELNTRLKKAGFKWICDGNVYTLHPVSLLGFLSHVRRWGQGAKRSRRVRDGESLRIVVSCVTSPLWGLKFCFTLHPILAVYFPLLRLSFLRGYLEG